MGTGTEKALDPGLVFIRRMKNILEFIVTEVLHMLIALICSTILHIIFCF